MLKIKFDAETFWKRENSYFFTVGEKHVAVVVPMGQSYDWALVLEYWEVLDGEHKGKQAHGMSFMDKEQTKNFMKLSNAVDGYFADQAEKKSQGDTDV